MIICIAIRIIARCAKSHGFCKFLSDISIEIWLFPSYDHNLERAWCDVLSIYRIKRMV